jgi:MSHA type pilus biogenesis protein MshL
VGAKVRRDRLYIALFLMFAFIVSGLPSPIIASAQDAQNKAPIPGEMPPGGPAGGGPEQGRPQNMPATSGPAMPAPSGPGQRLENVPGLSEDTGAAELKPGRISLDLKGIDILELLRILSMKMSVTIVPSKSVAGRVNVFLNNVSYKDAFDIVLISQDLAAEQKGNIINVMTAQEYERTYGKRYNEQRVIKSLRLKYAKPSTVFGILGQIKSDIGKIIVDESTGTIILIDIPAKIELMENTIKELDRPLHTEIFDIKYAKSSDIKTQLASVITTGPGELYVDDRSGKVAISDLPEKMTKIRKIFDAFDSAPQQVFIEAEVVEITLNNNFERGINWEKVFNDEQWIKWLKLYGGFSLKGVFPNTSTLLSGSYQQVNVGSLTSKNHYDAILKFIQKYGDTKILSRPRISAINNQEAKVMVGTRQAYVTATQSQGQATTVTSESVQFIDVGVKLNVVPSINVDGYITMKIKPEISTVTSTLTTKAGSNVPIVSTSEAETVVKVKDGTMLMIAGLMGEEKVDTTTGWPYLAKVPVLGALFSSKSYTTKKTELIIFLTPYIISGDAIVPGTEPEGNVPADLADDSIKRAVISRRINEINPEGLSDNADTNLNPSAFTKDAPVNVEEKMKGIKKY